MGVTFVLSPGAHRERGCHNFFHLHISGDGHFASTSKKKACLSLCDSINDSHKLHDVHGVISCMHSKLHTF